MNDSLDLMQLVAGLGLFLYGMRQLELALGALAGRPFKRFLKLWTARPHRGVVAGALSTAALQSSSVVSLIVLAFVGSGVISLASALGIVFGSNLGTTATGWIVATLGFKLDIQALALPLIGVGGLLVVWSKAQTRLWNAGLLAAGLGLMLMGLDFMKSGADAATTLFDPEALAGYPLAVFLGAGLLLTAAIQSSSATIMMTLSALYVGAIPLSAAAAVAIGADLGTTITAVLGAMAGSADKKRVALGIVLFNLVTDSIAFLLLEPLLALIENGMGIRDPLFALVAFHSAFNLIGVLLFLPVIRPMSVWLGRRFADEALPVLRHVEPGNTAIPDTAVENTRRETLRLLDQAAALNLARFGLPPDHRFYAIGKDRDDVEVFGDRPDLDRCYSRLKELEGGVLHYVLELQRQPLEADESTTLGRLLPAIRNAVHAAKSIRDIEHDLRLFRDSVNDRFNAYLGQFRESIRDFYEAASQLAAEDPPQVRFETLVTVRKAAHSLHRRMHRRIYDEVERGELSRAEISTLLNVNREIDAANRSMLAAMADTLLEPHSAEDFASLPESE